MGRKTVYNPIYTPEKEKLILQENKDLIKDFLDYLKATDKSPKTIEQYENDLRIYFIWNLENNRNANFININKRSILMFQNYCINILNVSSARTRRLRAVLSSLSNYIENILDDEYPEFRNIINKIPAPKLEMVREKTILSEDDCKLLLDILIENGEYQKACVLALAINSGSRKSELLRFKVSYFQEENIKYNSLYKTPEKIKTKGHGTRGKMLNKFVIIKGFQEYLDLWLKKREELNIDNEWLFVTKDKDIYKQMGVHILDSWVEQFSNIIKQEFYWHSIRHYFTTMLSKNNIPASVIKDIIGWGTTNMVDIYIDTEVDDEIEKYFNEDGVKKVEQNNISNL